MKATKEKIRTGKQLILLGLLLLVTLCSPLLAQATTITSATEYDYPPFSIVRADGTPDGFSVELLRAAMQEVKMNITFETGSWSEIKEELEEGELDALPLVGISPQRDEKMDFTVPYITLYGAIFTKITDNTIYSVNDLQEKKIIVMKDDNADEYATTKQLSTNITRVESYEKAFKLLEEEDYDAILVQELVGNQIIEEQEISTIEKRILVEEFRQDFAFAVKEGDKELLAKLNEGLSKVIVSGKYDELRERWIQKERKKNEQQNEQHDLLAEAAYLSSKITFLLESYNRDLDILKNNVPFEELVAIANQEGTITTNEEYNYIRLPDETDEEKEVLKAMENYYQNQQPTVDAIRLFHQNGYVIIGIVKGEKDTNDFKKDKSWFNNTLNTSITKEGENYLSPLSIARRTNTPSIRYATPITIDAERKGLLVINYNATALLKKTIESIEASKHRILLIDLDHENAEGTPIEETVILFDNKKMQALPLGEQATTIINPKLITKEKGAIQFAEEETIWRGFYNKVPLEGKEWYILFIDQQTNEKSLRLVAPEYPPYTSAHLQEKGFFAELVQESFKAAGYQTTVDIKDWSTAYQETKKGRYDGLLHIWYSPEREQWFLYSDEISPSTFVYCTLNDRFLQERLTTNLQDQLIGTVKDYGYPQRFNEQNHTTIESLTDIENIEKLNRKQVDFIVVEEPVFYHYVPKEKRENYHCLQPPIATQQAHLGLSRELKGIEEKLIDFNTGFKRIKNDGTYQTILQKHGFGELLLEEEITDTFRPQDIDEKARIVAQQLDNYIKNNPEKKLEELKEDVHFKNLALQDIGTKGYTALYDYDTLQGILHPNDAFSEIDYQKFKRSNFNFWELISTTKGGKESSGFYDWEEPNGEKNRKYGTVAIVTTRTADGKGIAVAATVYLEEYEQLVNPREEQTTIHINPLWIITGLLCILLLIYLLFLPLKKSISKEQQFALKAFATTSITATVAYLIRVNVFQTNIVLFFERLANASGFLIVISLLLISIAFVKPQKIRKIFIIITTISFLLFLLFMTTDMIIDDVYPHPQGPNGTLAVNGWFNIPFVILTALSMLAVPSILFLRRKKVQNFSHLLPVFIIILLATLIAIREYRIEKETNPLYFFLAILLLAILILFIHYQNDLLKKKQDPLFTIISLGILLLVCIFILNAHIITNNLRTASLESLTEKEQFNIENIAENMQGEFYRFIDITQLATELTKEESLTNSTALQQIYEQFNEEYLDAVYALDNKGIVQKRYPPKEGSQGENYSQKPGVQSAIQTRKTILTSPFSSNSGTRIISILFPLQNNNTTQLLRINIDVKKLEKKFLEEKHFSENGILLLIDDQEALINQNNKTTKTYENLLAETTASNMMIIEEKIDFGIEEWKLQLLFPEQDAYTNINRSINNIWYATILFLLIIFLFGPVLVHALTKSLRKQVQIKTKEIQDINKNLEKLVDKRTKELEELNQKLEIEVKNKTRQLRNKLTKEERSTKAIIYLLERSKKANKELQAIKEELQSNNEELQSTNEELIKIQKELEEEKRGVEEKVEERTNEIQRLLKVKTSFIHQLSHDLRTPLTPLSIFLPSLAKKATDEKSKKQFEVLIRNTNYLKELIIKTLDLSRIDSGKVVMNFTDVDITKLLNESIEDWKTTFNQSGIEIANEITKNYTVYADPLRIKEVIDNLMSNTNKYVKGGTLRLRAKKQKDKLLISFIDNGIGLDKEQQHLIFEEFYKIDQSGHDLQNYGLGLAIAKKIIEKHGGYLWAMSEGKSKGTTFSFTLPLNKPTNATTDN